MAKKLILVLLALFLAGGTDCSEVGAKVKYYSLQEKTRLSAAIIMGEVIEVRNHSVLVSVKEVLKGQVPAQTILVRKSTDPSPEEPAEAFVEREIAVFFLQPEKGGTYELFGRSQGKMARDATGGSYKNAISQLLRFDAAKEAEAKTGVLIEMLDLGDSVSAKTALEIVYLEFNSGLFKTDPLVAPVTSKTKDQDSAIAASAIRVLGRIGDKSAIPVLIGLLRFENENAAGTASSVLKHMTGQDFGFDVKKNKNEKEKAIRKWQAWWEKNKDTVAIIK